MARTLWPVARRTVGLAVLAALLVLLARTLEATSAGAISGRLTEASGMPLAGTAIVVSDGAHTLSTFTDGDGLFTLSELPVGTYTVTATLVGFEILSRTLSVVNARTTDASGLLRVTTCGVEDIRVDFGLRETIRRADAIVRLRVVSTGPSERCEHFCVCTHQHVEIVQVMKSPAERPLSGALDVLQEGAGTLPNGRGNGEPPYPPGQELIAFLRRDAESGFYQRFEGRLYAFEIHDGRVSFTRTDAPGLADGMRADAFEAGLHTAVMSAAIPAHGHLDARP